MAKKDAYGYVTARLRAMEMRFIDSAAMGRMLDADDDGGVLKILSETVYGQAIAAKNQSGSIDEALENVLLQTYNEVNSFVPDKELVLLVRMGYDFHNVKVLLKSWFSVKAGGSRRWDLLTSLASVPVDDMIRFIEAEDYQLMPFSLGTTIPWCVTTWEQSHDMLEIERAIDSLYFRLLRESAEHLGYGGVKRWVTGRIDAENLRAVLRLRRFGFDAAKAAPFIHEGGTLAQGTLLALLTEPLDAWSRVLSHSDFGAVTSVLMEAHNQDEAVNALEKALDDNVSASLSRFRHMLDAPENVLAYLWRKEMETKNLRIVFVSRSSRMDRDATRRLLRNG